MRKGLGKHPSEHPLLLPAVDLEPAVLAPEGDTPSTGCLLRWSSGLEGCGEGDLTLGPLNHAHPELPGRVHLLAAVMEPFSTGDVRLVSEDPTVDPQTDFRLLSEARDMDRMRTVAREMLALLAHPAIRSLAAAVTLDEAGTTPEDLARGRSGRVAPGNRAGLWESDVRQGRRLDGPHFSPETSDPG